LNVLNRSFFMLESVPKREMPAVLSAADLATSTVIDRQALWANSANKVFDALAAGRPIAINHEGWLAEMIRETGCGMVLPAHDLEKGAQQLVATLSDGEATRALRNAARQVARQRFDRDMLAQKLEAVIRVAAKRQNGRVTTAELQKPAIFPIRTNDKTLPAHEKAA
jgi:glycosyltransferase involved in cell wall biosynthesis